MGQDQIDILITFIIPTNKERVRNNVSEGSMNNHWLMYRDVLLEGQQTIHRKCNLATNEERTNKDIE